MLSLVYMISSLLCVFLLNDLIYSCPELLSISKVISLDCSTTHKEVSTLVPWKYLKTDKNKNMILSFHFRTHTASMVISSLMTECMYYLYSVSITKTFNDLYTHRWYDLNNFLCICYKNHMECGVEIEGSP